MNQPGHKFSRIQKAVEAIFLPLDRLFNRIFQSSYNPLYRSGTIAVLLMTIVTVTGLYLVFFYRLGEPFESISALQNQPLMGRWIRTLHRYASDATVAAVIIHMLRMVLMGRTWGPRTLAWLTGVALFVFLFVSGWTGYVMVWDAHAQALATAGAKMFDATGLFPDSISRSFSGVTSSPPASFFFLNLFLHVVVPLAMIFGIWIHTSKLARTVWFPTRRLTWGITGFLVLVSMTFPAPLAQKADLLNIAPEYPSDWWFSFWLPLAEKSPGWTLIAFSAGLLFLFSIPFWLKPSEKDKPKVSFNDHNRCQGCSQCMVDCPYEAIHMIPRTTGTGSPIVAQVNDDLCVACGLCAASCAPFTMGPPERKATEQFIAAKKFVISLRATKKDHHGDVLVMACRNQAGVYKRMSDFAGKEDRVHLYPVDCAGTIHAVAIEQLAKDFKSVMIAACPDRNCTNKDGFMLLKERVSGAREPTFTASFDKSRVSVHAVGDGEESRFFEEFQGVVSGQKSQPSRWRLALPFAAAIALTVGIALLSRVPAGAPIDDGLLRLSWRLSNQTVKNCRQRTQEELAKLPQHMRLNEICEYSPLSYRLNATVNGTQVIEKVITPGGLHGDRPIYVDYDLRLAPGSHEVQITFLPEHEVENKVAHLNFAGTVNIEKGRLSLIYLTPDQSRLILKQGDAQ